MTVTVGFPVYNGEKYLDETLASLCAQSFPDFTLLISDNASTDTTPEILDLWAKKDSRIKLVRQPKNIGAVKNFDYVLEQAKADWFMFAANADTWSKNYIESLLNRHQTAPDADIIIPEIVFKFENQQNDRTIPLPQSLLFPTGSDTKRVRSLIKYAHGSWIYGLHRRSVLTVAYKNARRFGYVWGWDLVALLPYILSARIAGTSDAVFRPLISDKSAALYRPQNLEDQWGIYIALWREVRQALKTAPLTRMQKIALLPSLISYTDRHSCKFRRIVKSAALYPFRKG